MRLVEALVQDFWCVENSEPFHLDRVTCLVGKNESGKTAILKALHKLKPDNAAKQKFVPANDYPRRKWRPNEPVPNNPQQITTWWEVESKDVVALEAKFGSGVLAESTVTVTKGFDNVRHFAVKINEPAVLEHAIVNAGLSNAEREPVAGSATVAAARKVLNELSSRTEPQEKLLQQLQTSYPKSPMNAVIEALDERLPTFLYFHQYLTLPGEVSLEGLLKHKADNTLTDGHNVFIALLSLAGTTPEKLRDAGTFVEFLNSLRAVSNQISDQIFKYWSQNRHLQVEMRLDPGRPNDPAPFNAGWVFRTLIHNLRHRADTNFDERSSGFVWFFSFLIWFNQLRQTYGKNLIILLDEPGLSLHARAQADLLRYINEQLRPDYQVIYTTHSPFMIDADHLLSARTVEDVVLKDRVTGEETLLGTKVGEKVLSTDPDTVSPLQKALDYELTQTLFIGRHTLLLEGASDILYLKWFSRQLEKLGKPGLDYRWSMCRVGGIDRIPGFISLFKGNGLHIAAVVDVKGNDKQKIENARNALDENHLLTLDKYAAQAEADIEDVLGREFFIALVTRALNLHPSNQFPATKPAADPMRVVKEVEAHARTLPPGYPEFDHFIPAQWLFQSGDEGAQLPGFKGALERMEKLIAALSALMP